MSRRRRRRRSTPTPAQIWRILHASAREARLARREIAEERRRAAHEEKLRKEEADAFVRQMEAERQQAEAEWRQAEAEWRQAEAERDKKLERELYRIYGDGDNRWGALIEALVEGNLKKILREAGLDVEHVLSRRRSRIHGIWREYDLVAVGLDEAVVVEVKTTLRRPDVAKFMDRIGNFREWRPDDARPRVFGAFAYLTAEGSAAQEAEDAGFYRIEAVSGSARLVNSESFEPRIF